MSTAFRPTPPVPNHSAGNQFNPRLLTIPLIITAILWLIGIAQWAGGGDAVTALAFVYFGVFASAGIGMYIAMPRLKRPMWRRVIMLMVGGLLLVIALWSDHGNMQIEGLFFGVLVGAANYVVLHYAIAKLVGPLAFGRVWCGWACWFGMVFDFLPYPYSRFRRPVQWGWLRYAHFVTSLAAVLVLWAVFQYRDGALGTSGLTWFVIGLIVYYVIGIGLAFALKDNRAFCKYLCPLSVLLKTGSRFSVLKVDGNASKCDYSKGCIACIEMCPLNVRVPDYILSGERVLSTECTLCQTCINICPNDALTLSFKFDVGGKEHIDYEPKAKDTRAPNVKFTGQR